ncbi:MAG TPA: tRNA (adenosine(37)-N6)-threonylcarbamoyltransferase complex transferase subunit TsaD [bacterium]|nr:tRNA (adenosine(37)-N6)-threonylcarbamoyltransferase complex transferase subunit TsaD [bacterium]
MNILAIETSCDETAAAVLHITNGPFTLLSNMVSSQIKIHARFGGVVPEVAARKQIEMVIPVVAEAVKKSGLNLTRDINYIAATQGPGLVTALNVGLETAKSLAFVTQKPLITVNHLAGHALAGLLSPSMSPKKIIFPALALVVSGGHTLLILMKNFYSWKIIGDTLDDAVGEAYDKTAQILNLGYPGGPIIDKLAMAGDSSVFKLPRPLLNNQNFDFSFSGLKTAVLYLINDVTAVSPLKTLGTKTINNICAAFQAACVEVLVTKTLRAIKKYKPQTFLLGGGVSANQALRTTLQEKIALTAPKIKILLPEIKFTGDNAAMISVAAYFKILKKQFANIKNLKANPHLSL